MTINRLISEFRHRQTKDGRRLEPAIYVIHVRIFGRDYRGAVNRQQVLIFVRRLEGLARWHTIFVETRVYLPKQNLGTINQLITHPVNP